MFRPGTSDGFNRYSNRNMRNTPKWKYNCAGYALGIFSWYCPYDAEVGHHFGDYDMTDEFSPLRSQALMECITQMLADFDDLRVIHSLKELEENEYAIAFRLSWDDFHYMRRADNGHWYEKEVPRIVSEPSPLKKFSPTTGTEDMTEISYYSQRGNNFPKYI